jgi:hypothetical protein
METEPGDPDSGSGGFALSPPGGVPIAAVMSKVLKNKLPRSSAVFLS